MSILAGKISEKMLGNALYYTPEIIRRPIEGQLKSKIQGFTVISREFPVLSETKSFRIKGQTRDFFSSYVTGLSVKRVDILAYGLVNENPSLFTIELKVQRVQRSYAQALEYALALCPTLSQHENLRSEKAEVLRQYCVYLLSKKVSQQAKKIIQSITNGFIQIFPIVLSTDEIDPPQLDHPLVKNDKPLACRELKNRRIWIIKLGAESPSRSGRYTCFIGKSLGEAIHRGILRLPEKIMASVLENDQVVQAWETYRKVLFSKFSLIYDFNFGQVPYEYAPWLPRERNFLARNYAEEKDILVQATAKDTPPYKLEENIPPKVLIPTLKSKKRGNAVLMFFPDGRNRPSYFLEIAPKKYACLVHENPTELRFTGLYNEETAKNAKFNHHEPVLGDVIGVHGTYWVTPVADINAANLRLKLGPIQAKTILISPKFQKQSILLKRDKPSVKPYMTAPQLTDYLNQFLPEQVYEITRERFFTMICTRFQQW